MKPTIIRTSNGAPWFHHYRYSTRGFAIRIAPRRMLALVRPAVPAPLEHKPLTAWDLSGATSWGTQWCRECRVLWPCPTAQYQELADASRHTARAWNSAAAGHVTAVTVCGNMLIQLLTHPTYLPILLVWIFTTCVVTVTIILAARNARTWRRIARTYEGANRD